MQLWWTWGMRIWLRNNLNSTKRKPWKGGMLWSVQCWVKPRSGAECWFVNTNCTRRCKNGRTSYKPPLKLPAVQLRSWNTIYQQQSPCSWLHYNPAFIHLVIRFFGRALPDPGCPPWLSNFEIPISADPAVLLDGTEISQTVLPYWENLFRREAGR